MKKILIICFVLFSYTSFCQKFTTTNVNLNFKGLIPEYQKHFKDNFVYLIANMNKFDGIDNSIVPITVNITYENNVGYIQMIVNYNHKIQMEKLPKMLKSQLDLAKKFGSNGFSINLPDLLMTCLNDYKEKVLKSSKYSKIIEQFKIKVRLKKADGSWIQFYCNNYIDRYGIPRYSFEEFADIKYLTNKMCRIEALNGSKLDDYKLWEMGSSQNADGTTNCDYNAYKFFEIE